MDMNSKVKLNGKTMSMIELADRLGIDLLKPDLIIASANILERRGQITVVENKTKEEILMDKAGEEIELQSAIEAIEKEEKDSKIAKRESKKAQTDLVKIALPFNTTLECEKFELWVNELGIEDTTFTKKNGVIKLIIKDITPNEYTKISTRYNADKIIATTVNTSSKVINGTTDGINYMATEVVAPVAKIAGEAGMNLSKGLFHTGAKVLASLINSGARAVTDTKLAMATDAELIKAQGQLVNAKNSIRRGVRKQIDKSSMGGGIEILE